MTDKQIIVNGVDVSGCKYWKGYCRIASLCDYPGHLCEVTSNCYYKQLKRKEQELQQAMDNYVQLDLQRVKEYNELVDLYKEKEEEAKHYLEEAEKFKNFLTEIKEIVHKSVIGGARQQILQKISECEVENEIQNKEFKNALNNFNNDIQVLNNEDRYKQALTDIEKYVSQNCGYYIPYGAIEIIRDIINKAKNGE